MIDEQFEQFDFDSNRDHDVFTVTCKFDKDHIITIIYPSYEEMVESISNYDPKYLKELSVHAMKGE